MKLVSDLNKFILGALANEEGGRVAFYHFLKNFCHVNEPVNPELVNRFLSEALLLPHWQNKKEELYHDIQDLLQKFSATTRSPFNLGQIWNLPRMQILPVEHIDNLYDIVKEHEQSQTSAGENLRIVPEGENRVVAILKNSEGRIFVRTYTNLVRVQGSTLIPLEADQELKYDSGLELLENTVQRLRCSPHTQVIFSLHQGGVNAHLVAGFAMRRTQDLKQESISLEPKIFYPLKRLERFYIYRSSDPYYNELITTLDRAIYLVRTNPKEALDFARQAFEGGQIAFDQIFPDDRQLHGKLKDLVKIISSHTHTSALQL